MLYVRLTCQTIDNRHNKIQNTYGKELLILFIHVLGILEIKSVDRAFLFYPVPRA